MTDSATINEAVDLLECAGWKGYAKAVREQSEQLEAAEGTLTRLRALVEQWRHWASNEKALSVMKRDAYTEAALTCADELLAALEAK